MRRCAITPSRIEILVGGDIEPARLLDVANLQAREAQGEGVHASTEEEYPVTFYSCDLREFGSKLFRYTGAGDFLEAFVQSYPGLDFRGLPEEKAVFERAGMPFIAPELRESGQVLEWARQGRLPALITEADIKGVVHAHSTYSDGLHSLRDMALHARALGYGYLVISDHSKSAFYANGLQPERVMQQWAEIDELNAELAPFRIFKSIESDILNDGSLDYEADILARFDCIIASVHSNLRMDEDKATQRLITAIENPYTTILGHPTGRLLLSRKGYPIDHRRVIDACAANRVAIEINANPYRLDLDWQWIPYALEKGVKLCVNPDAHSKDGIRDIHYGVCAARKGGLSAAECLNALDAAAFAAYCSKG
jgi:DNA polymerase (family 10)